jgi:hypothetical protein
LRSIGRAYRPPCANRRATRAGSAPQRPLRRSAARRGRCPEWDQRDRGCSARESSVLRRHRSDPRPDRACRRGTRGRPVRLRRALARPRCSADRRSVLSYCFNAIFFSLGFLAHLLVQFRTSGLPRGSGKALWWGLHWQTQRDPFERPLAPQRWCPPTSKLIRQILGAISEFDKAMTVAKLRGARERKRREVGK